MVEQNNKQGSTLLTEEEAEIYDRQIRLWGVEAQQRLRKAKILLVGLSSLGNEVSKNILLSGVQHMTLLDDAVLSEEDCKCQFLTPFESVGENRAKASLASAKNLNPMVNIVADTENIENKPDDFLKKFDVVCMTGCSKEIQVKVNKICHRLGIKFLSGNVFGYYGYMFADFGVHKYTHEQPKIHNSNENGEGPSSAKKSKTDKTEMEIIEKVSSFCSLSDALSVKLFEGKNLRQAKQVSKTYLVMKVLQEYEKRHGGLPTEARRHGDVEKILDVRNDVFELLRVDNDLLQDDFASYCVGQLYPVSAIIGGIMGQEVIKTIANDILTQLIRRRAPTENMHENVRISGLEITAGHHCGGEILSSAVSGKDAPHNNFFFYDGVSTSGVVENISLDTQKKVISEEKPEVTSEIIL